MNARRTNGGPRPAPRSTTARRGDRRRPRSVHRGRAARASRRRGRVAVAALVICTASVGVAVIRDGTGGSTALGGARPASPVVEAATAPSPDVRAWVVVDGATGGRLGGSRADVRVPIGSITKLMTAKVVLAAGRPDHPVTAPAYPAAADESVIGLRAGEVQQRDVLFRAMVIVSAGDAADALAVDEAGSRDAFVARMNAEAQRLGMTSTRYANPVGLDAAGQYSTAADTARLARDVMRYAQFRDAAVRPSARLHGVRIPATNTLLGAVDGMDGVKTGHTRGAGWCMVASASRGGHRVFAVVLGAPSRAERDRAVRALLEWGFARRGA